MLMLLDADWRAAAQLMRAAVTSGRHSGWPLREHIALIGQGLNLGKYLSPDRVAMVANEDQFNDPGL